MPTGRFEIVAVVPLMERNWQTLTMQTYNSLLEFLGKRNECCRHASFPSLIPPGVFQYGLRFARKSLKLDSDSGWLTANYVCWKSTHKYPNEWIMMNFRIWIISRDFMSFEWWRAQGVYKHVNKVIAKKNRYILLCAAVTNSKHIRILLWWWWINICRRVRAYLLLYSLHRQLSPEHKPFFRFHFTVCLLFAYCARRISIALPTALACARIPKCRCSFLFFPICINMICLGRNFAIKQCANK